MGGDSVVVSVVISHDLTVATPPTTLTPHLPSLPPAAERALKEMMGGTLDRAESEDESLALVRPAFMDMDPAKWTDEQKKAAQEYKAREVAVKEERDKRVMGLETEVRGWGGRVIWAVSEEVERSE